MEKKQKCGYIGEEWHTCVEEKKQEGKKKKEDKDDFRKQMYGWKKKYVHNIFTIFSQKIINGRLLLVVTSGKKKLSDGFKLKPVTTYHLKFVVKMLWT